VSGNQKYEAQPHRNSLSQAPVFSRFEQGISEIGNAAAFPDRSSSVRHSFRRECVASLLARGGDLDIHEMTNRAPKLEISHAAILFARHPRV